MLCFQYTGLLSACIIKCSRSRHSRLPYLLPKTLLPAASICHSLEIIFHGWHCAHTNERILWSRFIDIFPRRQMPAQSRTAGHMKFHSLVHDTVAQPIGLTISSPVPPLIIIERIHSNSFHREEPTLATSPAGVAVRPAFIIHRRNRYGVNV